MGWAFTLPSGRPVHVVAPWHPKVSSSQGRYVWKDDTNTDPDAIVVSGEAWYYHVGALDIQLEEIQPGLAAEFARNFQPPKDWDDWVKLVEKSKIRLQQRLEPEERLERVADRLEALVDRIESKLGRSEAVGGPKWDLLP